MTRSFLRKPSPAQMLTVVALTVGICSSPASAGEWVNGGTFDPQLGVATNFLRFLAEEGEGQMTIRCDAVNGLWIDAGVGGNGELPSGAQPGDDIDVSLTLVAEDGERSVTATGMLVLRGDGAILVSITSPAVDPVGRLLLQPAERLDITVAGETRPVSLDGVSEDVQRLADRCEAWPQ